MPFDLHIASYMPPKPLKGIYGAYMNFKGEIRWEVRGLYIWGRGKVLGLK